MRRPLLVSACLLVACGKSGASDTSAFDPDTPPPKLVDVVVACDGEKRTWTVQVETDAWAGGAVMYWTVDGVYVEKQTGFRSVAAAADGTSDALREDIAILTDFRPYQDGATAFTCRDAVSAAVVVLDLDREPSDCVRAGASPDVLVGLEGVPECPRVLGGGDTDGGDTDGGDTDGGDTDG